MKAMSNFLRTGSVSGTRMLVGDGADPGESEHLPLQRFDNNGNVDDNHKKWSEDRNQEHRHPKNAQRESHNNTGKPHNETLHRMEAHEFILAIRIKQKESDRRHKRKISQSSGNVLWKLADLIPRACGERHRAAATRTKGRRFRHLC